MKRIRPENNTWSDPLFSPQGTVSGVWSGFRGAWTGSSKNLEAETYSLFCSMCGTTVEVPETFADQIPMTYPCCGARYHEAKNVDRIRRVIQDEKRRRAK